MITRHCSACNCSPCEGTAYGCKRSESDGRAVLDLIYEGAVSFHVVSPGTIVDGGVVLPLNFDAPELSRTLLH